MVNVAPGSKYPYLRVLLLRGIAHALSMRRRYNQKKASRAIGLKVRALRETRGWTLEGCEERGWANWKHLQRIESGQSITVYTLINLANLFGVHPSELLNDI
jgi:hypothetical protein